MANDGQPAVGQLVAHHGVDRQALDLLVIDEVVVVLAVELGQARALDQLLDLRRTGLLFGLLLLLTVELLITRGLFGLCLQRSLARAVVQLCLALVRQTLLLLLLLANLLGCLLYTSRCV